MKMEINRHNYEEYFLLYIDNELSVAERNAVDVFVEQNPDLHAELEALQQSLFLPEEKIVFPGIEGLFKNENANINADNREEYFVLYHDGELTASEERLVEEFVHDHPQYKVDFELVQKARLEADKTIIFENKEVLYKHEKTEKVVYFAWLRWSAAAAVIVIAGLLWFNKSSLFTGKSVERPIASIGDHPKNSATESNPAPAKIETATQPANGTPANPQNENPDGAKNQSSAVVTATTNEVKSGASTDVQNTGTPSATNDNEVKNNAAGNPSIAINDDPKLTSTKVEPVKNDVAVNDPNVAKINEHIKPNITNATLASEGTEQTTDNADIANNESSVGRKSGLRGFIRKATRVIERNANVDPEERPGIMIGNFAIATK